MAPGLFARAWPRISVEQVPIQSKIPACFAGFYAVMLRQNLGKSSQKQRNVRSADVCALYEPLRDPVRQRIQNESVRIANAAAYTPAGSSPRATP